MTLKGGTSQACAACKYQRRKCTADCPLAPYFPPDQPKMFQNAHRLFGVRKISKMLEQLDPSQRMDAMKSIIYQANVRDRSPVLGCLEVINQLLFQIQSDEEELHAVHAQLALYRQQQHHEMSSTADPTSQLQLGMAPPSNALSLFQDTPQPYNAVTALPHNSYSNSGNPTYNINPGYVDNKDSIVNSWWAQQPYSNSNSSSNPVPAQSQMIPTQTVPVQQEATQDYDEIHPFFDTIDDRQSYIDSKEAYESSSESSLKDTTQSIEHIAENELKSAAACFSLTSVN